MAPNLNVLWSQVLLESLGAGGVRHLCISPGSRSSPLVVAASRLRDVERSVHLDERSAAFFALGLGKSTGQPAVLICTSGTAAANLYPAVIEASLSSVPLILLTADRPPEAREAGAAQTIDQLRLFGRYVRFFQDLPVPEPSVGLLRSIAEVGAHACAHALSPLPGPVHLNVPFREPLAPEEERVQEVAELERSYRDALQGHPGPIEILPASRRSGKAEVERFARLLAKSDRGLLVAGPEAAASPAAAEGIARLARAARMPLLADIASGLRFSTAGEEGVCAHAEAFLRAGSIGREAPDLVVRLGRLPTSKMIQTYLSRHRPPLIQIQTDLGRRDPDALTRWLLEDPGGRLCGELAERLGGQPEDRSAWQERFAAAEGIARTVIGRSGVPLEALAVREAVAALPPGAAVFFSNSLPIRYGETYASTGRELRVFVSRGANGIDGITSTALGVACGLASPLLLVTGDLAFLHDLGGLRASRHLAAPAVILLLNNNGGGIFSHLPIASFPELCEPFFATPHDCDLAPAAQIFGLGHARASSAAEVAHLVAEAIETGGTRIIELGTDRNETAHQHAGLMEEVATAVDRELLRSEG